jgi:hypothetical protein
MENKISEFKDFFEDAFNKADPIKRGNVQFAIPYKDLGDLTKILANAMYFEEKCVAPEVKNIDARQCELADTVAGMTSSDYKKRFKAEYYQTKIRYERLKKFNTRIEAAGRTDYKPAEVRTPMPKHDCPDDLLIQQQRVMGEYLHILEVRAVIEGVDL